MTDHRAKVDHYAARAYAQGMLKALPRVVGAEKPSVMVTTRQAAALIRAAFKRGAQWARE